jgi:hypothetical protein
MNIDVYIAKATKNAEFTIYLNGTKLIEHLKGNKV